MAKSSIEKALEKYQKEVAKSMKQKMQADKRLADKQRREESRRAIIDARRERAASIVSGQPTVGNLKILDKTAEELVNIIYNAYSRTDYKVTNNDVEIPQYMEGDLQLEFEKLKQYGLISQYGYYITGAWEISILPCMLTYMQDKEDAMSQEQRTNNYTNVFNGNVTDVQIQQGTVNSIQTKTVTAELDYEAVGKLVEQIRKYDGMLDAEFGENAVELREKVKELSVLVQSKNNPSRIKVLLGDVKSVALKVTGSIIASGILDWLKDIQC